MTPPHDPENQEDQEDQAGLDELATLTLAQMQPLLESTFRRANPPGPDIELQLLSADSARRDSGADPAASERPFSLVFRGPREILLTQGMHDLEHPQQFLRGVFLVPIGADENGPLYEAVFG